jgi:hypothetical protein
VAVLKSKSYFIFPQTWENWSLCEERSSLRFLLLHASIIGKLGFLGNSCERSDVAFTVATLQNAQKTQFCGLVYGSVPGGTQTRPTRC